MSCIFQYFWDRYAVSRTVPVLDECQDWMLVSGGVENGHTILEFKRHLTTCDNKDMDITVSRKLMFHWF